MRCDVRKSLARQCLSYFDAAEDINCDLMMRDNKYPAHPYMDKHLAGGDGLLTLSYCFRTDNENNQNPFVALHQTIDTKRFDVRVVPLLSFLHLNVCPVRSG